MENNQQENDINLLTYKPHIIKKYIGEDSNQPIYSKHKRHVFVMTQMARPIYSRYGDEIDMSPFMATLNTIIEKFITFFGGDTTRSKFQKIYHNDEDVIYFMYKKGLYYICKTSKNDSDILIQNMLDFLNLQIVSIVSDLVNLRLEKKPNYDFRNMLGGTTVNLGLAIKNGLTSPSILLRSWMPMPMLNNNRSNIHSVFREYKNQEYFQCLLLLSHTHVFDVWYTKDFQLKSMDIILIQNLLQAQSSFRSSENWLPICLPGVSSEGYIYLFVAYLTTEVIICMVSDNNEQFQECKIAFHQMKEKFNKNNIYENILNPAIQNQIPIKMSPQFKQKSKSILHFIVQMKEFNQYTMPDYNNFGKQGKTFKQYLNRYAKQFKNYLQTEKENRADYLNFVKYPEYYCGISGNSTYLIFFIMDGFCTLQEINQNLGVLKKWIQEEEHKYFILQQY